MTSHGIIIVIHLMGGSAAQPPAGLGHPHVCSSAEYIYLKVRASFRFNPAASGARPVAHGRGPLPRQSAHWLIRQREELYSLT